MSGYYYPPHTSSADEEEFAFQQTYQTASIPSQGAYPSYPGQPMPSMLQQRPGFHPSAQYYPQPAQQYQQTFDYPTAQPQHWMTPTVPSNYPFDQQNVATFPPYTESSSYIPEMSAPAGPSRRSTGYLSPDEAGPSRVSRSTSFASNASSVQSSYSQSDVSRSVSPNASEMAKWGFRNENGSWSCSYPGCSSRSTFNRGCDLRKHYKRHTKSLFCRHEGCPSATEGGFSSKKDRARHEAKHNPQIVCEWEGCDRLFSRVDNMKDHVRRVHKRKATELVS